ncbi:RHS repeat-associated core domain-containing protein [Nitrospirillum sp. BR 11163]|uniref:RHS repeat-associated core domain-containing protein n=1 Tax=Nitrospirillum sp. BR 11163 TaxID=3104323 RepID=UPI003A4C6530
MAQRHHRGLHLRRRRQPADAQDPQGRHAHLHLRHAEPPGEQGTLDSSTGALAKVGYLAFGENPAGYAGATFRYTGQRLDPETGGSTAQPSGLYDYRARAYSPTLGRFLQADPAGYSAGANLYAYVSNDPLNLTDSTGLVQDGATAGFNWEKGKWCPRRDSNPRPQD